MYKFASALGLITLVTLSGCATAQCGDAHAYKNSTIGAPLKAPAGMSVPKADPSYKIPGQASSKGKQKNTDSSGACIVFPPAVVSSKASETSQPAEQQQGATKAPAAKQPAAPKSAPASPAPAAATSAAPAVATG